MQNVGLLPLIKSWESTYVLCCYLIPGAGDGPLFRSSFIPKVHYCLLPTN